MAEADSRAADTNSKPTATDTWASYGLVANAEFEDFLVGSSKGLQRLKEHIEIAIEKGESSITEGGIEFNGVRRIDVEHKYPVDPWWTKLIGMGCLTIIASILILAYFGLKFLFS
jgi:hypothetical protein